jgi:lipopolysaccharide export LptBFGC system permease protein LptF
MGGSAIRAGGVSRGRIVLLGGMIALLLGIVSVAVQREASQHTHRCRRRTRRAYASQAIFAADRLRNRRV